MEKLESLYNLLTGAKAHGPGTQSGQSQAEADYDHNSLSVVLFSIGKRSLAIGVEGTEGVVDCPRISPLPSAPDAIVGVVSVRGKITLVLDADTESSRDTVKEAGRDACKRRLILLKGEAQLGLLADQIQAVLSLPTDAIRYIPENRSGRRLLGGATGGVPGIRLARSYFKHGGRKVPVLDLNLLSDLSS